MKIKVEPPETKELQVKTEPVESIPASNPIYCSFEKIITIPKQAVADFGIPELIGEHIYTQENPGKIAAERIAFVHVMHSDKHFVRLDALDLHDQDISTHLLWCAGNVKLGCK